MANKIDGQGTSPAADFPEAGQNVDTEKMENTMIKGADTTEKATEGILSKRTEGNTSIQKANDKIHQGVIPETSFPQLANYGVKIAAARFKAGEPGFAFQNSDQTIVYRLAIRNRVNTDKRNMKACIEGRHIETLRANPIPTTAACSQLMNSNRELFSDPEKFEEKWKVFVRSLDDSPIDEKIACKQEINEKEPIYNLSAKGYHNEYHANEMYADTIVKLHEAGIDQPLCIAGGTMAYFHDLVQGLDGFPGLGKNENVTVKFLNFLIDEQVKEGEIDQITADALKSLSNATIVGGTFLVGVCYENEEGKTVGKNQTPSECVNNSDLRTEGHEQDYDDLNEIRGTMAKNDISRTQGHDYMTRPDKDKSRVDETTVAGKAIGRCYDAKAEAYDKRNEAIRSNPAFQGLAISENQFARVCQSVRMLTEILPKIPNSTFNEKAVVDRIRNGQSPPHQDYDASHKQLIGKLQNPITWSGGMINDKFIPGEAQFARPSGHNDYAEILEKEDFKARMAKMPEDNVERLIECALSSIQDGKYIGEYFEKK